MHRHSASGFSLIQVSILLAAAAIVLASLLPGGDGGDFNQKTLSNIAKLDAVEASMNTFMAMNGRRPCPADGSYDVNAHNFGLEAGSAGVCTSTNNMGPSSNIITGTIPTKTLGLPDDYALDAWGRRFTYVVDTRATSPALCFGLMTANPPTGGVTIKDGTGATLNNTMYAYISHGADGHGAFPAQGSDKDSRINKYITDADSLSNASELVDFSTHPNNTFVKKDRTTGFDDLLYYHTDTMNTCCIGNGCSLASPGGFVAQGSGSEKAGSSIAFGDINGDGIDDLIIGAPNSANGKVYVIFGTRSIFPSSFSLSGGLVITGANASDKFGSSVAVGDVNGDGIKDIIIGAPGYNAGSNVGAVYVIFGGSGTWNSFNVSALNGNTGINGTNGFRIDANTGDTATGTSVASGDINGDGVQDIIIGAPGTAGSSAGKAYVVFGVAGGTPTPLSSGAFALTSIAGSTKGFEMDGSSTENAGTSVASGDINGDGTSDVIVGAPNATSGAFTTNGNVYVVFGNTGTWNTGTANPTILSHLAGSTATNGTNGFVATGASDSETAGTSVASGDINGDGIADLIIGAPNTKPQGRTGAGSAYIVLGQNAAMLPSWPATVNLGALTTTAAPKGFRFDGAAGELSGTAVAAGCSVNGTGIADILIGAPHAGTGSAGTCVPAFPNPTNSDSYVVFGASTGWVNTQNLCNLDDNNGGASPYTNGFYAKGLASGDLSGSAIAAGDINGVGKCATAVGAPGVTVGGNANSGAIYVIMGRATWSQTFDLSTLR